jgi:hypothetical protein
MPRFPRPGPPERRSPASSVLSGHYDFLCRIRSCLWIRSPAPTLASSFNPRVGDRRTVWPDLYRPVPRGSCGLVEHRISQVPGESIPCLCPALRPRSVRNVLTLTVISMWSPHFGTMKTPTWTKFRGSMTRLRHLLPTLHELCYHSPCKAHFRLVVSLWPGGSRTLWTPMKGFSPALRRPPPFPSLAWRYPDFRSTPSCSGAVVEV